MLSLVAGAQVTAAQYADDAEPFLSDDSAIPPFEHPIRVLGDASGQNMQPTPSRLLSIGHGASGQQPPPADGGVVHSGLPWHHTSHVYMYVLQTLP